MRIVILLKLVLFCFIKNVFATSFITCNFANITGVNFGNINILDSNPEIASGSFNVECTNTDTVSHQVTYEISFDLGLHYVAPNRTLLDIDSGQQQHNLPYNYYKDVNYTQILQDGTNGTYVINGSYIVPASQTASDVMKVFYAKIPVVLASKYPIGHYTDTINMTITITGDVPL